MIEIKNLSVNYGDKNIIKKINFKVNYNEMFCLAGPNGSGKTTILNCISNLIDFEGDIFINETNIKNFDRASLSRKITVLSQIMNNEFSFTVFDTVMMARYPYRNGIFKKITDEDENIVLDALKKVDMENYKNKLVSSLSGGQKQRIFLAKCFAQQTDILLLDEPTNHLDLKYQIEIIQYIKKWCKDKNKIVIAVLHDFTLINNFFDKISIINNGEIEILGDVSDALKNDKLNEIYNFDLSNWFKNSYKLWCNS